MPRVADSNALYAFFDRDDPHTEAAIQGIEDPDPIHIPREILVETSNLLELRHGYSLALEAVTYLLHNLPHAHLAIPVDLPAAHRVYREADGTLSLADAIVVQTCRTLGAEPFSFDARVRSAV